MLKKSASFVLASFRPSTYRGGLALALPVPVPVPAFDGTGTATKQKGGSPLHSLQPCWTAFLSILLLGLARGSTQDPVILGLRQPMHAQSQSSSKFSLVGDL